MKPMWDVCHNCEQCWNGEEQYCAKAVHTGLMTTGSYQEYVITPAIYTSRIPDGVPDDVAGPIVSASRVGGTHDLVADRWQMCSASTMPRALKDSGFQSGEWVVFPGGGGGVGMQGVQLAKIMGMRPIVVDSGKCGIEGRSKTTASDPANTQVLRSRSSRRRWAQRNSSTSGKRRMSRLASRRLLTGSAHTECWSLPGSRTKVSSSESMLLTRSVSC